MSLLNFFFSANKVKQKNKGLHKCVPMMTMEERFYLMQEETLVYGLKEVNVIQACQLSSTNCLRLPSNRTFYKGTSYERKVDVGVCGGRCANNRSCEPEMRSKIILSPNGKGHER